MDEKIKIKDLVPEFNKTKVLDRSNLAPLSVPHHIASLLFLALTSKCLRDMERFRVC